MGFPMGFRMNGWFNPEGQRVGLNPSMPSANSKWWFDILWFDEFPSISFTEKSPWHKFKVIPYQMVEFFSNISRKSSVCNFVFDKFPMYLRLLLVYVDVLRSGGASAHLQRRFCVRQRAAGQPWHEVGWGVDNPGRWRRCMKITFYSLVCNSLQASQSWKIWKIKEDYALGHWFSDVSTTK